MIVRWKASFPVGYLCAQLGVSVSGFYEHLAAVPGPRKIRRDDLIVRVITAFSESNSAAGYRKITHVLRRDGVHVNRKTVAVIMSELGLISPAAVRQHKVARDRKARGTDPEDLVLRDFASVVIGRVLVGDITYVRTWQGWLYVATVIDLASRTVLGYATGSRQTAKLAIKALKMAHATGLVPVGAIFHTDHGVQYTSKAFTRYCGTLGVRRSMGKTYTCWDNACAETFFSKLKSERLEWIKFKTRAEAARETVKYVAYYNEKRLHQNLGYITPHEKLEQLQMAA